MADLKTNSFAFCLFVSICAPACGADPGEAALGPGATTYLGSQHNFKLSSRLEAATQKLPEKQDSTVQWTGLRHDVQGHAIDPVKDVHKATLLLFPRLTSREVLDRLAADQLQQSDVGLYMECVPQTASCALSKFGLLGSFPGVQSYFEPGRGAWLVMLSRSGAKGGLAFAFLEPSGSGQPGQAVITDATSSLATAADLRSPAPARVRADGDTRLDWSGVSKDGLGNDLVHYKLDRLTVARYSGTSLQQLEGRFVDLEVLAAQTWQATVSGEQSASLRALRENKTAQAFAGFSSYPAGDIWLLALRCDTCNNPAPKVLSVLSVEGMQP